MGWSAYSLRHHFAALLLTLPLMTMTAASSGGSGAELYKAMGLAAFLIAAAYYVFLYKYKVMFTVGLVFSSIFTGLVLAGFVFGLFFPCGLFKPCSVPEYIFEVLKGAMTWTGALFLLNVGLIVAYEVAGRRLGLRESYE